jgi:hypothetical protein
LISIAQHIRPLSISLIGKWFPCVLLLFIHQQAKGQKRFVFSNGPDVMRNENLHLTSTQSLDSKNSTPHDQISVLISFDEIKRLKSICTDSILLHADNPDLWITGKKIDELIACFEHNMDEKREIRIVRIEPLQIKPRTPVKIDLKSISMSIQLNLDPGGFMFPVYWEEE